MEKRKKDHKLASAPSQEPETLDHSSKDDQNEQNVALVGKNIKTVSPSKDNTNSENNQCPPILLFPYTPQNSVDQSPLTSKTPIPTQSTSPIIISQWHFPHQRQNLTNHPVQQGQLPLNYTPSTPPFWLPQRPSHALPGMNAAAAFQPLIPFGTTEVTWQGPAVGGGTAPTTQPQVPNFCYPVGYTFPGLPGPCDPLSWWGQAQQSQPLCTYAFPGAYNYFSSTPSASAIPTSSTSPGQSFQRGIIRPQAKLSQKHQQLWDAQSAENVQLWNVINHLQSEIADYKNRLLRLEAEVSSFKPKVEETTTKVTGTASAGQPSKRGRPKRSVASVDAGASPDESHPRTRGRKPATSKVQFESKAHLFEKVILNKAEDKEKACHSTANIEQNYGENVCGNVEINGSNLMMPVFNNQAQLQICGIGFAPSLEMKVNEDKATNSKATFSILSQQSTGINSKRSSAAYMGVIGDGNLAWPDNIASEESGRNVLGSQGFYSNSSVIRQGGKLIPGWSFANEEDASEEIEDAVLGSAKDENDEMEEDASSGAEDMPQTKDNGAYNADGAVGTSPFLH